MPIKREPEADVVIFPSAAPSSSTVSATMPIKREPDVVFGRAGKHERVPSDLANGDAAAGSAEAAKRPCTELSDKERLAQLEAQFDAYRQRAETELEQKNKSLKKRQQEIVKLKEKVDKKDRLLCKAQAQSKHEFYRQELEDKEAQMQRTVRLLMHLNGIYRFRERDFVDPAQDGLDAWFVDGIHLDLFKKIEREREEDKKYLEQRVADLEQTILGLEDSIVDVQEDMERVKDRVVSMEYSISDLKDEMEDIVRRLERSDDPDDYFEELKDRLRPLLKKFTPYHDSELLGEYVYKETLHTELESLLHEMDFELDEQDLDMDDMKGLTEMVTQIGYKTEDLKGDLAQLEGDVARMDVGLPELH